MNKTRKKFEKTLVRESQNLQRMSQRCMTPNCAEEAINSHQLSVSQLKQIEDRDYKVIVARPAIGQLLNKPDYQLFTEATRGSALTFRGFCAECDQKTFIELDDNQTAHTPLKSMQQAYRSHCYHFLEEKLGYLAKRRAFQSIGIVGPAMPCSPAIDPRIASSLPYQWKYRQAGFEDYKILFEEEIASIANNFSYLVLPLKDTSFEIRCSSSTYLNQDLFDQSKKLDWNNSGKVEPQIFWQLLGYNGQNFLTVVVKKAHKKFADEIISELLALSPYQRGFHLFRYFAFSNLGTTISGSFFRSLLEEHSSEIESITSWYALGILHGRKAPWQTYPVPSNFPALNFSCE